MVFNLLAVFMFRLSRVNYDNFVLEQLAVHVTDFFFPISFFVFLFLKKTLSLMWQMLIQVKMIEH